MSVISLNAVGIAQVEKNNFSNRVEMLLDSRGCTKAWLANELGITRQALNHLLKHGKKPKFVSEIAIVFNVSPKWLETGEGSAQQIVDNVLISVPLYELSLVVNACGIENMSPIDKILLKPDFQHHYFAILFQNCPSMSPRFEENSILIFDQNISPQNGSYVLANMTDVGIVIRQFFIENTEMILKPANDAFDMIKCHRCDILGTLIETRIKF